jgi:hypothetical protein
VRGDAGSGKHTDPDADHDKYGHDENRNGMFEVAHHAARNEYRIVLATMPFPANPMETNTGCLSTGRGRPDRRSRPARE